MVDRVVLVTENLVDPGDQIPGRECFLENQSRMRERSEAVELPTGVTGHETIIGANASNLR